MKLGILTYHSVPNFGANLQALSTVSFFKKKGFTPIIINWVPEDLEKMYSNGRISKIQYSKHNEFVSNYLPVSKLCRTEDDIIHVIESEKIEGIFIGSDAVLCHVPASRRIKFSKRRLKYIKLNVTTDRSFPNPFWGSFISKLKIQIPLAIFSASSQNMPFFDVENDLRPQISKSLSNFKYISARDKWTKEMLQFFNYERSIDITPDPVFAFNNNFSKSISKESILKKFKLPEDYVLVSFRIPKITRSWVKRLELEFNKKNIRAVGFPMPEGLIEFGLEKNINVPLDTLDWYYLIKFSRGYIGERMHPVIVSIHNNVPFFSFDEYGTFKKCKFPFIKSFIKQSSKIYDILSRANLLEYSYTYNQKFQKMISPKTVVSKILNFDKKRCSDFSSLYENKYEKSMNDLIRNVYK